MIGEECVIGSKLKLIRSRRDMNVEILRRTCMVKFKVSATTDRTFTRCLQAIFACQTQGKDAMRASNISKVVSTLSHICLSRFNSSCVSMDKRRENECLYPQGQVPFASLFFELANPCVRLL